MDVPLRGPLSLAAPLRQLGRASVVTRFALVGVNTPRTARAGDHRRMKSSAAPGPDLCSGPGAGSAMRRRPQNRTRSLGKLDPKTINDNIVLVLVLS